MRTETTLAGLPASIDDGTEIVAFRHMAMGDWDIPHESHLRGPLDERLSPANLVAAMVEEAEAKRRELLASPEREARWAEARRLALEHARKHRAALKAKAARKAAKRETAGVA